jgi:hypothetical protein
MTSDNVLTAKSLFLKYNEAVLQYVKYMNIRRCGILSTHQ